MDDEVGTIIASSGLSFNNSGINKIGFFFIMDHSIAIQIAGLMISFCMIDFDQWNELKKKIEQDANDPNKFPKEGEVWMSNFGRNIGFEQNGSGDNFSRPVLITKKFNNHMFWVMSLSTKQKRFDFYFNYVDPNEQKVSAILAQLKLMSVKRLKRKI